MHPLYCNALNSQPSGMTTPSLEEHLGQLVRFAPPGTLVPVESLASLLEIYASEPARAAPAGLSLGEVAERFARTVDGQRKMPQEGTVRKWIRVGLRGVKLRAFRAGRTLRVLEPDLDEFVRALAEQPLKPSAPAPEAVEPVASGSPESEIESYLGHFRRGRAQAASAPSLRRGAAGPANAAGAARRKRLPRP